MMRIPACLAAITLLLGSVFMGISANAATDCKIAFTAKAHYAPQILAFKNGWFKAPGIDFKPVDLGMTTGIAAAEALISGSADVAVMGDVPAIIALTSAKPCVLVCSYGSSENMHSIIVTDKSGIKEAKDLDGKKIGVHFGSSTHGGLQHFLDKNNLTGKAKLVNTPQKNLIEVLTSGSVDAISASEPTPNMALAKVPGARKLASLSGLGNDYPLMMVATKEFADKHPEAIKAVVAGTRKADEFINADIAKAAAEIAPVTGVSASMEETNLKGLDWKVRMDPEIIKSLEQTAEFLHGIGRLKKVPDIAASSSMEFVK